MQRGVRAAGMAVVLSITAPLFAGQQVWFVPWKVLEPGVEAKPSLLAVYWIPSSPEELRRSDLLTSRALTGYSSRCVAMHVVRIDDVERMGWFDVPTLPVVVLAEGSRELARRPNGDGVLRAMDVEAMVRAEFDAREIAAGASLDEALRLLAGGDTATAIAIYQKVAQQRCAFPREAKVARRALRRLGR
ncbi:MAG: hypothetical protein ACXW2P_13790 [Thermoanaerobaculia bacterium]